MGDGPSSRNTFESFINAVAATIDAPVEWFRGIVTSNRTQYNWYHQKFRRVPTIDQCYTDDIVCYTEANLQFKRDRAVDTEILAIMRQRFEDCSLYERPDLRKCDGIWEQYLDAADNWFIKYGDLGGYGDVRAAYMKQKHRMVWERRHGPVGSGMREKMPQG